MTTEQIERRMVTTELRVEKRADGQAMISGHAAVFHSLSEDLGGFREKIAPGAFAESVSTDDIRALFNHNANFVLGRNRAGTLRLREDAQGLATEIDAPDTQAARDLATSIERGDISGWSFGFRTISDLWERKDDGMEERTLVKVRLIDVSPVTFPAYPQTDLALRSLDEWRKEQAPPAEDPRDVEVDILVPGLKC